MPFDTSYLGQVIVCGVLALVALRVSACRDIRVLLLVGLLALPVTVRERAFGYLVAVAAIYVFSIVVNVLARRSKGVAAARWRGAVLLIFLIMVTFTALRLAGSESVILNLHFGRVAIFVLDMWLVLRLVTFVWEVGAGRVSNPKLLDFGAWVLNPFTLFGPILRFSEFQRQSQLWSRAEGNEASERIPSGYRVSYGIAQMAAGIFLAYVQAGLPSMAFLPRAGARVATFYLFAPWSFYLMVAGYFKLMESFAQPWGIVLPPSFDRAFAQKNVADFWARWNMTATGVFRDYAFFVRWGLARPNVYLNTLIVFLLVGLWHGANAYWILWGAFHGLGFCAYLLFRRYGTPLRRWGGRLPARLREGLSVATTYVFVCSCWAAPPWLIQQATGYLASLWRMLT